MRNYRKFKCVYMYDFITSFPTFHESMQQNDDTPNVFLSLICRCICGVLADKLVVLVTHQLQYAQHADSILVLKEVYI